MKDQNGNELKGWGSKLKFIAQTMALGQQGKSWDTVKDDEIKRQRAQDELDWVAKERSWKEQDRPTELQRQQREAERQQFIYDEARRKAEREGTTFTQGQEDRTRTRAQEEQDLAAAKQAFALTFPDLAGAINGAGSMGALKQIVGARQAKSTMKANEALAGLRGVQTAAGGWNPNSGRSKVPTWGPTQEMAVQRFRSQLQKQVQDGVLTEEQATAQWQEVQRQAKAAKAAAMNAQQNNLMTGSGVSVDASSLPKSSGAWKGVPYMAPEDEDQ